MTEQSGFFIEDEGEEMDFFDEAVKASSEDDDDNVSSFGFENTEEGRAPQGKQNHEEPSSDNSEISTGPIEEPQADVASPRPRPEENEEASRDRSETPRSSDEQSHQRQEKASQTSSTVHPEPIERPAAPVERTPERPQRSYAPPMSSESKISEISRIISIIDLYRKFNDETRESVTGMVTQGEGAKSEGEFVYKVLNVDPLLAPTMTSLRDLKEMPIHKRGIAMLRLEDEVFESVAGLTYVFVESNDDESANKFDRADMLVEAIENLTPDVVGYIKATESVLRVDRSN